jgi:hypothetical protein
MLHPTRAKSAQDKFVCPRPKFEIIRLSDYIFSIFHWTGTSGLPRTIPYALGHSTCDINVTKCLRSFFKWHKNVLLITIII